MLVRFFLSLSCYNAEEEGANLGTTGRMVLPKEESWAMKYPKEVLVA